MTLTSPIWLMLMIPLGAAIWLLPYALRALTPLRIVTFLLLVLALAGLSFNLPSRNGCVVVVADRSLSMPVGSQAQQQEMIDLVYRSMGREDELAVVSFGQRNVVEQSPQHAKFPGFVSEVGNDASNLADAMDRAVSLVPRDRPGRILVLSDGQATGKDVAAASARAANAGIAIDYRAMRRSTAGDLAIERIDAPASVTASEVFLVSAWINSPQSQEVSFELRRGQQIISSGKQTVAEGRNRLLFRDRAAEAGSTDYTLQIRSTDPAAQDPVTENNTVRFLVGVRGIKPVLCLWAPGSNLSELLRQGGIKIDRRTPDQMEWTLARLSGYSGVVIENVPADKIGTAGMETLSAWVTDAGGGLLTTGGMQAYGAGGYFKSVLEPILPVSMELRREHRKLSLAIVVALDRSGSMAATVPGGRTKMDLANVATVEVLSQLSGADQFGCLAVDSMAHEIVPLSDLSNKASIESKLLKIDSLGGGIFVYEALEKAAAMIAPAVAGTRHIILFSDAADSEEPGDYVTLLEKCRDAGITVSVIGLGSEHDSDAALLKDVALKGGGQCMFTEDPHELPRLFAQDTFLVSRSTFIEEPTTVKTAAGMTMLTTQPWGEIPQLGGYNLCYLRPGASLAAVTTDDYRAPVIASWQAGSGRVMSYTGEADGKYTGPLGKWEKSGEFFSSLVKWVSTQDQGLGPDMLLTQEIKNGTCRFQLHLDSERQNTPFSARPQLKVLRANDGEKPELEQLPLSWTTADVLSAEVPVTGTETLLASLDLPGIGRTTLPPIRLPYSAEYAPHQEGAGMRTLERMARATSGTERVNLSAIWSDLPRMPRLVSLAPWLLLAGLLLVLIDVLQQRTGISLLKRRRAIPAATTTTTPASTATTPKSGWKPFGRGTTSKKATAAKRTDSPPQGPVVASPSGTSPTKMTPPPASPAKEDSVMDALAQARSRASRRTHRDH